LRDIRLSRRNDMPLRHTRPQIRPGCGGEEDVGETTAARISGGARLTTRPAMAQGAARLRRRAARHAALAMAGISRVLERLLRSAPTGPRPPDRRQQSAVATPHPDNPRERRRRRPNPTVTAARDCEDHAVGRPGGRDDHSPERYRLPLTAPRPDSGSRCCLWSTASAANATTPAFRCSIRQDARGAPNIARARARHAGADGRQTPDGQALSARATARRYGQRPDRAHRKRP
jgi:hypothetical protein